MPTTKTLAPVPPGTAAATAGLTPRMADVVARMARAGHPPLHRLSAEEAKAWGIVDHVYDRREQAEDDGVKTV